MIIKSTDILILRDLEVKDKENYIKNINDKNILKYMGGSYPYYEKKFDKMLEVRSFNPNSHFCFGFEICGEIFGEVSLNRIEKKISNHVAAIGYWLSKKYWGQAIIIKAMSFVCDFVFDKLKFKKIVTEVFPENVGSLRILEKNDFILE